MKTRSLAALLVLAALLAAGCRSTSPPVAYYTLHPLSVETSPIASSAHRGRSIGIGPLDLPEYLEHPYVVTRITPNRLQINEDHRWAGPLSSEIVRVLAADLSVLTNAQVLVMPWSTALSPDMRVRLALRAFEAQPDGTVLLMGEWTVAGEKTSGQAEVRSSTIREPVQGDSIEDVAAAMSRALAALSREIAAALKPYQTSG